ncbi:MAG: outer membrane lipoprotein chaperone LolA [Legionellales bacterium]|nr:outer membrane lipoprotein chaperone LolA [Legionellales bacterium]
MQRLAALIGLMFLPLVILADAREQLANQLEIIQSMTAHFSQQVQSEGELIERSRGEMAMLRPGRFRWETHKPNHQLLIADGQRLWIYDVDLEQVQVKPLQGQLGQTPALFLSGYDQSALNDYQISIIRQRGATIDYRLIPIDPQASFAQIDMTFRGNELTAMRLGDQLGQSTELTFSKVKVNTIVDQTLFQFEPPAGVDVIQ